MVGSGTGTELGKTTLINDNFINKIYTPFHKCLMIYFIVELLSFLSSFNTFLAVLCIVYSL